MVFCCKRILQFWKQKLIMYFCLFSVPNLKLIKAIYSSVTTACSVEDVLKMLRSIDFIEIRIHGRLLLFINLGWISKFQRRQFAHLSNGTMTT